MIGKNTDTRSTDISTTFTRSFSVDTFTRIPLSYERDKDLFSTFRISSGELSCKTVHAYRFLVSLTEESTSLRAEILQIADHFFSTHRGKFRYGLMISDGGVSSVPEDIRFDEDFNISFDACAIKNASPGPVTGHPSREIIHYTTLGFSSKTTDSVFIVLASGSPRRLYEKIQFVYETVRELALVNNPYLDLAEFAVAAPASLATDLGVAKT